MTVEKASKIIRKHYGNANILQVRKPHRKKYFIVDMKNGSHMFNICELEEINRKTIENP